MGAEPGFQVTIKKTPRKRIKAEILEDGTRVFSIHNAVKAADGKKIWVYTKYRLEDDGKTTSIIRMGKYPYSFTK